MGVKKIKIIVVGDGESGKTCLLERFVNGSFPKEYVPCTAFDNHVADMALDGKQLELSLWDTAGSQDYDKTRVYSYPNADVALVCFGIDSPTSLYNIPDRWLPDLKELCPNTAIIIVGNKKDIRTDQEVIDKLRKQREEPVPEEQGKTVAHMIRAYYMECSALKDDGVQEVFHIAAKVALKKRHQEKDCVLM